MLNLEICKQCANLSFVENGETSLHLKCNVAEFPQDKHYIHSGKFIFGEAKFEKNIFASLEKKTGILGVISHHMAKLKLWHDYKRSLDSNLVSIRPEFIVPEKCPYLLEHTITNESANMPTMPAC